MKEIKLNKLINLLENTDSNLILMVGIVLTGKSTFIKKINEHIDTIISRDDIVLELGNGKNYSDSFKTVNQKMVSVILRERINKASKTTNNVVIDMMSQKSKSRKAHLKSFPNHTKIAVVTHLPKLEILLERNKNRFNEEGKFIPENVIRDLKDSCTSPQYDEGFDYIVYLNEKGE